MERLLSRRALVVTGKGGVGKTVLSAAVARLAAGRGKRVLVAELASRADEPSPLARALGTERWGDEPVPSGTRLDCVQLTPQAGHRRFLEETIPVPLLAEAALRSPAVRRFLGAAPGFAEMGVLYRYLGLLQQREPDGGFAYDLCIFDAPATGHALAIAQLPGLISKLLPGGTLGRAMREGLALLSDPAQTAALIVSLPEALAASEALELAAGLARSAVPLLGAVVNRLPRDPFAPGERALAEGLCAEQGPMWGARSLRRLDRARLAVRRLEEGLRLPVLGVPELEQRGADLAEAAAQALADSLAGLERAERAS